jgi:tetratricopeptide (TPR) repeat protein
MGIAYYKLKEYQAAIDAFEKAIKIKPDAYENYNSVGAAYIKLFESQLIQTQDFDNLNEFFVSANGFLMRALLTIRITKVIVTNKYTFFIIKSQGNAITWWLSAIGIFFMAFAGYGVFVIEDKIDSFNELLKEAESTLIEIKTHEKKAKKYEEKAKVSAATAEKLAYPIDSFEDPEVKLTKKTEQEVKKSK